MADWGWVPALRVHTMVCESSKQQSASALIHTGKALLVGAKLITDGVNDASLVIYDNTAASGDVVDRWDVSGSENYGGANFPFPVGMETGIYGALTGTGASFVLMFVDLTT